MTRFEARIWVVRSNRSTNWATQQPLSINNVNGFLNMDPTVYFHPFLKTMTNIVTNLTI